MEKVINPKGSGIVRHPKWFGKNLKVLSIEGAIEMAMELPLRERYLFRFEEQKLFNEAGELKKEFVQFMPKPRKEGDFQALMQKMLGVSKLHCDIRPSAAPAKANRCELQLDLFA